MGFSRDISFSLLVHGSLIAVALLAGGNSTSPNNRIINIFLSSESSLPKKISVHQSLPTPNRKTSAPQRAQSRVVSDINNEEASKTIAPVSMEALGKTEAGKMDLSPVMGENGGSHDPSSVQGHSTGNNQGALQDAPASAQAGEKRSAANSLIKARIKQHLIYPYLAIRKGLEGTVITEFEINARGLPERIIIVKSCGHPILDKAATDTILKAAPFPVVSGNIEVPITFRLSK